MEKLENILSERDKEKLKFNNKLPYIEFKNRFNLYSIIIEKKLKFLYIVNNMNKITDVLISEIELNKDNKLINYKCFITDTELKEKIK